MPAFVSHQVTAARRFYLNLKPRASRTLTVVCGGYEECAPDYRVSRRTFPYLCVEFVAAGRGDVTLGGRTHALEPGSLFTYGPGVAHTIRTAPDAPLAKYFVDFVGRPGPARLRECGPGLGGVTQVPAIGEVREAFETLVRLGAVRDRRTAVTCGLQLDLLLHTVARARRPSAPAERRARATFERCREHLDTHFLALGSVAALAAACHVDASHLCRLFRRFRGEPPLRYLQSRRMHWAAERLHTSGALVREVADELGIDPFQFSRAFKRVHGLSPTAFLGMRAGH